LINWINYPDDYRSKEINQIINAISTSESVSLVGLSGSGKTNILGYLANRVKSKIFFISVDGNRLLQKDDKGFLNLIISCLPIENNENILDPLKQIESGIQKILDDGTQSVCFLIDRLDILNEHQINLLGANLRSIRDAFKYQVTFVICTRKIIPLENEISELVLGNTIWIGVLSQTDAKWSIQTYADRKNIKWSSKEIINIINLSGKYPSFLRAICEAYAQGVNLNVEDLLLSSSLKLRLKEFWLDDPSSEALEKSLLNNNPLISKNISNNIILTEKEFKLLKCFQSSPDTLLDKETIIQSVWPEDQIFENGIRDDSLAQLIRRLRKKLDSDLNNKSSIQTVSGRGYIYHEKQ
jgi:ABC-type dipeptide/oligopeptide/nickel transport system ATPase subunit